VALFLFPTKLDKGKTEIISNTYNKYKRIKRVRLLRLKNRLLEIRLKMGFKKAEDFAKYIKTGQSQYSRYENQEVQPSLKKAIEISKILKMKVEEIFYLDSE